MLQTTCPAATLSSGSRAMLGFRCEAYSMICQHDDRGRSSKCEANSGRPFYFKTLLGGCKGYTVPFRGTNVHCVQRAWPYGEHVGHGTTSIRRRTPRPARGHPRVWGVLAAVDRLLSMACYLEWASNLSCFASTDGTGLAQACQTWNPYPNVWVAILPNPVKNP
eukprot:scaffold365270_cov16-Prasinocladus_malaysianus.AAC.1